MAVFFSFLFTRPYGKLGLFWWAAGVGFLSHTINLFKKRKFFDLFFILWWIYDWIRLLWVFGEWFQSVQAAQLLDLLCPLMVLALTTVEMLQGDLEAVQWIWRLNCWQAHFFFFFMLLFAIPKKMPDGENWVYQQGADKKLLREESNCRWVCKRWSFVWVGGNPGRKGSRESAAPPAAAVCSHEQ